MSKSYFNVSNFDNNILFVLHCSVYVSPTQLCVLGVKDHGQCIMSLFKFLCVKAYDGEPVAFCIPYAM